jgi:hypothetical protein
MTEISVDQLIALIKQQFARQEKLNHLMHQTSVLAEVALIPDFVHLSKEIIHTYLVIVADMASRALQLSEDLLNQLNRFYPASAY